MTQHEWVVGLLIAVLAALVAQSCAIGGSFNRQAERLDKQRATLDAIAKGLEERRDGS